MASSQGAKSLELRAATSRARLWMKQGRTIEAKRMLGEMYGWFSGGIRSARSARGQDATRSLTARWLSRIHRGSLSVRELAGYRLSSGLIGRRPQADGDHEIVWARTGKMNTITEAR